MTEGSIRTDGLARAAASMVADAVAVDSVVAVVRSRREYRLLVTRPIQAGAHLFDIVGALTRAPSRYTVQVAPALRADPDTENLTVRDLYQTRTLSALARRATPRVGGAPAGGGAEVRGGAGVRGRAEVRGGADVPGGAAEIRQGRRVTAAQSM